ncbi:ERCC4 domain protein [Pseudodesulfovibrio profundus]|uniref:ERCC4 domain protein n=1 Tax=Pseudodesulfovibrio profundus TaxID=57320 RepID=A0A2C8FDT0_9BACT|nr:ERCC4 domain-containing protein [Pseudodesulfovibrio profundus]SOB60615.1 ERCC4 domain protein [Pseudodesulfovibrio profundus]
MSDFTIIVDSREQAPFTFERFPVSVEVGTLTTGDYAIKHFEHRFGWERKSLEDLYGSMFQGRERFAREMHRARGYEYFAVVVEAPYSVLFEQMPRRKGNPKAFVNSCRSWAQKNGIQFWFARTMGNARAEAEAEMYQQMRLMWEREIKTMKTLQKALEAK